MSDPTSTAKPDLSVSPLDRGYDKVLVIRINHSYAGFFAYVTFAINQLIYAEKNNYLPVVYFGEWSADGPNAFFDRARGDNTWDYYFEPVAGYTFDDIRACVANPNNPLELDDLVYLTVEEAWHLHLESPDSVYNYPYGRYQHKADYDEAWYEKQRDKAHDVLSRYVRVKPHIMAEVDGFVERFFDRPVIGLHLRGTDKGTAGASPHLMRIIPPASYFPFVDRYSEEHGPCRIFVATDQVQFLEQVRDRYGDRVVALDAIRTTGAFNAFQTPDEKNYVKGREVLIDCLLLSRCDSLLKCSSAVGEYATYFNRDLPDVDLNHVGSQSTVLDPVKVAFARARQGFRINWRNLRSMEDAGIRDYGRLVFGYNPLTSFVWGLIERRRYERNPVSRALVWGKDHAWALASGEAARLRYASHLGKVRERRRGARHFHPADSRFLEYLEIRTDASMGSGFFTQFLMVLRQLHFAVAHELQPVVCQDHAYHPNHDSRRGPNVWDYYFHPVGGLTPEHLDQKDPMSIALLDWARQHNVTFADRPTPPEDPAEARAWRRRTRLRGARLIERFVRLRDDLEADVGEITEAWQGRTVLGVHQRVRDGARADAFPSLAHITPHVDEYLEGQSDAQVFVATNDDAFLRSMRQRYGDRVLATDARRLPGKGGGGFESGREALIDMLALSRSAALIRGPASLGEVATYFNPDLPVLDLGRLDDGWEV